MRTTITIALLFALTALSPAQILRQGDTEALVTTLGMPCEPGDRTFGFWPCPPIEAQGVLIHVRADGWNVETFESYAVTVTYKTVTGEQKTTTSTVKRERSSGNWEDDGWRAIGFNVGRVATPSLPGIKIESVKVSKVMPPVTITIGETAIGAPQ